MWTSGIQKITKYTATSPLTPATVESWKWCILLLSKRDGRSGPAFRGRFFRRVKQAAWWTKGRKDLVSERPQVKIAMREEVVKAGGPLPLPLALPNNVSTSFHVTYIKVMLTIFARSERWQINVFWGDWMWLNSSLCVIVSLQSYRQRFFSLLQYTFLYFGTLKYGLIARL